MSRMMKVCGKSKDGKALPFAVDAEGNTLVKRVWETANHNLMSGDVIFKLVDEATKKWEAAYVTEPLDVSNWGFVSLRIMNSTKDGYDEKKDIQTFTLPVKINFYGDRIPNDGNYVKDINGNTIDFFAPSGTEITVIPEELPVLNYLQNIKARLSIDVDAFKTKTVEITETGSDGQKVPSTVSVFEAAQKTINAAKNNTTISPKVEIKAYINFNVITKR